MKNKISKKFLLPLIIFPVMGILLTAFFLVGFFVDSIEINGILAPKGQKGTTQLIADDCYTSQMIASMCISCFAVLMSITFLIYALRRNRIFKVVAFSAPLDKASEAYEERGENARLLYIGQVEKAIKKLVKINVLKFVKVGSGVKLELLKKTYIDDEIEEFIVSYIEKNDVIYESQHDAAVNIADELNNKKYHGRSHVFDRRGRILKFIAFGMYILVYVGMIIASSARGVPSATSEMAAKLGFIGLFFGMFVFIVPFAVVSTDRRDLFIDKFVFWALIVAEVGYFGTLISYVVFYENIVPYVVGYSKFRRGDKDERYVFVSDQCIYNNDQ